MTRRMGVSDEKVVEQGCFRRKIVILSVIENRIISNILLLSISKVL